jgi:hypothetical protein
VNPLTAQASWVQTAVTVAKVVCAVRAMRYVPVDTVTIAAPPTAASGDAASIVTVRVRFDTVPDTDGTTGAELGDVLLPPQPGITAPRVNSDTA